MSRGLFRQPVTLEAPVSLAQPDGAGSLVYTPMGQDFADIRLLRQSEAVLSGRLGATATHAIRLRQRADIAPGWRITGPKSRFRILSCTDEDRRRAVTLCLAEAEEETA